MHFHTVLVTERTPRLVAVTPWKRCICDFFGIFGDFRVDREIPLFRRAHAMYVELRHPQSV